MGSFLNKIKNYFIMGLAVLLPVLLTFIILKWLIGKVNIWFLEPYVRLARPYTGSMGVIFLLKVVLFFVIIIIIIFCGAATKVIFMRKFFGWGESLFIKTPLVSKIYTVTKEVSVAVFGHQKGLFRKVVLIEYPRQGLFAIGFVTREQLGRDNIHKSFGDDMVSVFIPTAPNPTTGALVIVKKTDLLDADMNVEEALKLILSGGTITPARRGNPGAK